MPWYRDWKLSATPKLWEIDDQSLWEAYRKGIISWDELQTVMRTEPLVSEEEVREAVEVLVKVGGLLKEDVIVVESGSLRIEFATNYIEVSDPLLPVGFGLEELKDMVMPVVIEAVEREVDNRQLRNVLLERLKAAKPVKRMGTSLVMEG